MANGENNGAVGNAVAFLPGGTRVISLLDGEDGHVMNPFDNAGIEYEVMTEYGIERWMRADFITFAEAEVEE
ncbi:MAG: hypothetical protein ACKVU4_00350 [Phycisphaerales bacterium]